METPKGSTPNPSGMEIRRRLTTPTLAQQQQQPPQSMSRPQNAQTSSSSSAALGASFIQDKPNNENSSPAKQQRPGPNASRMLQNATSIVGRCEYYYQFLFLIFFYLFLKNLSVFDS